MSGYRRVLAVPGMAPLLGVSLLARTAITADVTALTLYVVLSLELGYVAAGAVAAALTTGVALGGPLLGRLIDSRGLRTALLATLLTQAAFWLCVPLLRYEFLLVASVVAGLLMVPVQAVSRQAIAAMTRAELRRAGFALESVQGELSYIVGPAVVIMGATVVSPEVVAWGVGATILAGGSGIALLDPPMRADDEADAAPAERLPHRRWLTGPMIAALTMALGTTALLGGVDLAIIATLREAGQVSWAAVVIVVFGVSSVVGGLSYGALTRPLPTWFLLGALGLVTIPVGLADHWPWLCVAVVASGLLTAPTLATVADAVSRLAPPGVRGEATGLQSSAQSAGFALGAPLVGVVIDLWAPAGGFAAAGLVGLAAALFGRLLSRNSPARSLGVVEQRREDQDHDPRPGRVHR
ncbi:MFS transporter [Micromonospora sp. CA-249363]|uniref:MFS transporter n=1 Tax=Micromonospora sp. CA-249363 TaxID=3239963 RepID=UPI003D89FF32